MPANLKDAPLAVFLNNPGLPIIIIRSTLYYVVTSTPTKTLIRCYIFLGCYGIQHLSLSGHLLSHWITPILLSCIATWVSGGSFTCISAYIGPLQALSAKNSVMMSRCYVSRREVGINNSCITVYLVEQCVSNVERILRMPQSEVLHGSSCCKSVTRHAAYALLCPPRLNFSSYVPMCELMKICDLGCVC